MTCTWSNCPNGAEFPQFTPGGKEYANLCEKHNKTLNAAVSKVVNSHASEDEVQKLLGSWIKAKGKKKI